MVITAVGIPRKRRTAVIRVAVAVVAVTVITVIDRIKGGEIIHRLEFLS